MKNYARLVPEDSFMGRYLKYMSRQETAHSYDWWTGLWVVAAACGRRTYVARPRAPVYLNMYVVLIGESGVARKTTAVSTAGQFVRRLHDVHPDAYGFLDAKMTGEKLDELLHNRAVEFGSSQLCIAIPELAVFLGTEHYIANMPTLLTDLYDCPSHRHGGGTIARGAIVQRDVWLSFLSASTPIWLLKTVNPNVVEGGFTSRCMFIVSNSPKRKIPWPDADDGEHERVVLHEDLLRIYNDSLERGVITLTPGAFNTFKGWYNKRKRSQDVFKQSFEAREDAHVLRVAALLCVNDDSWRIDVHHLQRATQLVAELKETSSTIFESAELRTKFASALDTIRSTLISAGMDPVPRGRLYMRCRSFVDNVEFLSLLEVLHEVGAVQRFEVRHDGAGRPIDFIRGTQLLLARGLGEQVMERFS